MNIKPSVFNNFWPESFKLFIIIFIPKIYHFFKDIRAKSVNIFWTQRIYVGVAGDINPIIVTPVKSFSQSFFYSMVFRFSISLTYSQPALSCNFLPFPCLRRLQYLEQMTYSGRVRQLTSNIIVSSLKNQNLLKNFRMLLKDSRIFIPQPPTKGLF